MGAATTSGLPAGLRWIGFDLDDTLHYFERASKRASDAILGDIGQRLGIGIDDLRASYEEIVRSARARHFSQRKTSREYRSERFRALLGSYARDPGPHLDRMLDAYDATLAEALELKPGARRALAAARAAGLSVMVVSEGPSDAQATTIDRLGIAAGIDLLVTSSDEGLSKTDGLLARALERARCGPSQALYVGDSVDRDIVPASSLGMASVYVGGGELPGGSSAMRLDLMALAGLLADA